LFFLLVFMKYVNSKQMREIDRVSMKKFGVSIFQMMENAGRNLARFVSSKLNPKNVVILYGKGNNGGGGLVAARHLAIHGVNVSIVGASRKNNKSVEHQLGILGEMNIKPKNYVGKADVIIDALLGYSIKGNPLGKYAELIERANIMKRKGTKIVSLDLPSGLDPDSGKCYDPCINADYTITLALPKIGLKKSKVAGKVYLANIGIPLEVYRTLKINVTKYFKDKDIISVKRGK